MKFSLLKPLKTLVKWIPLSSILFYSSSFSQEKPEPNKEKNILNFTVLDIDGKPVNLSQYKDKVVMIVNVASKCGFTEQYSSLQSLYLKYQAEGFVILGFPSNDFLGQEPGTNDEIKKFCSTKFNVTFPMFDKVHVRGKQIAPLFKYLTDPKIHGDELGEAVSWNFNKFLINKKGELVAKFGSRQEPLSTEIATQIMAELKK